MSYRNVRSLTIVISCIFIGVYSSVLVGDPRQIAKAPEYKPDELLVRFAPDADGRQKTRATRNAIAGSLGIGRVSHDFKLVQGLSIVRLPEGVSVERAMQMGKGKHGIRYIEPNYKIELYGTTPNDPNFRDLWGMRNTGETGGIPRADIDALRAWYISTGSNRIIVAVIDSGIDYTHPDLVANIWVNSGEIPGNGIDDDGNGYVDDVYGCNAITRSGNPMDDNGHGTHCAGTIGATGNNGIGVAGVCWNVELMAVKFLDSTGSGWNADAIAGIEYAVANGSHVLSNSWGRLREPSQSMIDAIEMARGNGVLFVAAAGNDGWNNDEVIWDENGRMYFYLPASYECENIIAVMASDSNDRRPIWEPDEMFYRASNYGPGSVDIAAPGSAILSCLPNAQYASWNGTSMATPHVAGACALVLSVNPLLKWDVVKDIILDTADQTPGLAGLCVSDGRLNLYKAAKEAGKRDTFFRLTDNASGSVGPGDQYTYTIVIDHQLRNLTDPNFAFGNITVSSITLRLPAWIDPVNASDPCYNPFTRVYTWNSIGTITQGSTRSFTLAVQVNEKAIPHDEIVAVATINTNELPDISAVEDTTVRCWSGDVIYVDPNAPTDHQTGTSWEHAYKDLQTALAHARTCSANGRTHKIWVAKGTYVPGYSDFSRFDLPPDTTVYGGFAGGESSTNQRNIPENRATLTGEVLRGTCSTIVSIKDAGPTAGLDAVIISDGLTGVVCDNSQVTLSNSIVERNTTGVLSQNADSSNVIACTFVDNDKAVTATQSSPLLLRNWMYGNGWGIYGWKTAAIEITGNLICHNTGDGIGLFEADPNFTAVIRNNTVAGNLGYGVEVRRHDGPNADVFNCILWGQPDANDVNGVVPAFSCIEGYSGGTGSGNFSTAPGFMACWQSIDVTRSDGGTADIIVAYPARYAIGSVVEYDDDNTPRTVVDVNLPQSRVSFTPPMAEPSLAGRILTLWPAGTVSVSENWHISEAASCYNAGDPSFVSSSGEKDIDHEPRIHAGRVDVGADEVYFSPADFNGDLIVDFFDYAMFAGYWRWTGARIYDINDDIVVDMLDLAIFADDWLWESAVDKLVSPCMAIAPPIEPNDPVIIYDPNYSWDPNDPEWDPNDPNSPLLLMGVPGEDSSEMCMMTFDRTESALDSVIVEQEAVDIEALVEWAWNAWNEDPELQAEFTKNKWQEFINQLRDIGPTEQ